MAKKIQPTLEAQEALADSYRSQSYLLALENDYSATKGTLIPMYAQMEEATLNVAKSDGSLRVSFSSR